MKLLNIINERGYSFDRHAPVEEPQDDVMNMSHEDLIRRIEELTIQNQKLMAQNKKIMGNSKGMYGDDEGSSDDIRADIERAIRGKAQQGDMTRPEARPYGR